MSDARIRKAVFLDRDGTIIQDTEFSTDTARLRPMPNAIEGLRKLQEAGYLLIVITNQSGVARGDFDEPALQRFHDYVVRWFGDEGIKLTAVYYCPHYPEGKVESLAVVCDCRKPAPGMLLEAAGEHGIDLTRSWMIGDRHADVGAGIAAGCRTIRVLTGPAPAEGDTQPDSYACDLSAAAETILGSDS